MAAIDWRAVDQAFFERLVEALAPRLFEGRRTHAINGAGGDGGIDIAVVEPDGSRLHAVLQLKFFPEGFSGGFSTSRRSQIRKSWRRIAQPSVGRTKSANLPDGLPERWILVIPCNLKPGERAFIGELTAGSPIQVDVWDRAILDGFFAKHDDVVAHFQGNLLDDRVRLYNQERAMLSGGLDDLAERVRGLQGVADAADPHWGVHLATTPTGSEFKVFAKHPQAAEVSPITIQMKTQFSESPEDQQLLSQLRRFLEFGEPIDIELSEANVPSVRVDGPDLLQREGPVSRLHLGPNSEPTPATFELSLRFRDADSNERLISADPVRIYKGTMGVYLQAVFFGVLIFEGAIPLKGGHTEWKTKLMLAGAPVPAALTAVRLLGHVDSTDSLELLIDGKAIARLGEDNLRLDVGETEQLLEDFAVVHELTGQFACVPDEIDAESRFELRIARLLLEGKTVQFPWMDSITFQVNDANAPEVQALRAGKATDCLVAMDRFTFSCFGKSVLLGNVEFLAAQAVARPIDFNDPLRLTASNGQLLLARRAPLGRQPASWDEVAEWGLAGFTEPTR